MDAGTRRSRGFVPLVDPSTEEEIAQASSEGIDFGAVLDFAREQGGPALRALTFAQRAQLLKDMSKVLRDNRDELLDLSARNTGTTKPDGSFDVDGGSGTLAYYASLGRRGWATATFLAEGEGVQLAKTEGFYGRHVLVPRHGVAVHINAFNFPAWGFAEKAACALLAGMPVITKPATATALVTERVHRADRRGRHPARGRSAAHHRLDRRPARPPGRAGRPRLHRLGGHRPHAALAEATSSPPTPGSTWRPTA